MRSSRSRRPDWKTHSTRCCSLGAPRRAPSSPSEWRSWGTSSSRRATTSPGMSTWADFVRRTLAGEPDDAHVALLRTKLAMGHRVMQVRFERDEHGRPTYILLLERLHQLSELRVPHSSAFTRWSIGARIKMSARREEVQRFSLLVDELVGSLSTKLGAAQVPWPYPNGLRQTVAACRSRLFSMQRGGRAAQASALRKHIRRPPTARSREFESGPPSTGVPRPLARPTEWLLSTSNSDSRHSPPLPAHSTRDPGNERAASRCLRHYR